MSRVHDALRKAAQESAHSIKPPVRASGPVSALSRPASRASQMVADDAPDDPPVGTAILDLPDLETLEEVIRSARAVSYTPLKQALMIDLTKPHEPPAEEFRSLRTRLNHLQTVQPLHTLVITSASPAEGKSFTAVNLAVTEAQLAEKRVLLADFDFRRPSIEKAFQVECVPGITDYLLGTATLRDIMRKVEGMNLYLMTAGSAVPNPLELLNLKECKALIDALRDHFDWVIIDSPPLLFTADGNLLSTICDATVLVVRIGATTFDSVTRAMQSLCENNVIGIVVNGARRGELYSKYTYYRGYYAPNSHAEEPSDTQTEDQ